MGALIVIVIIGVISYYFLSLNLSDDTKKTRTSNYKTGNELYAEMPKSFRVIQDLLVKIDKKSLSPADIQPDISLLRAYLRMDNPSFSELSDRQFLKSAG